MGFNWRAIIFILVLISLKAYGDEPNNTSMAMPEYAFTPEISGQKSVNLGHNLSQTSYIPKSGVVTLGTQATGMSLTNHFFIATSPWLFSTYNMYNVNIKATNDYFADYKMAFMASYFKTGDIYPNKYNMEAVSAWVIKSIDFSNALTTHFNLNLMYFFDETLPFSMRREPYNDQPGQLSISALNELRATNNVSFGVEFGVVGLTFNYPNLHAGLSVNYHSNSWLAQLGVSATTEADNIGKPFSQEQVQQGEPKGTAIHPEIQLQYFL